MAKQLKQYYSTTWLGIYHNKYPNPPKAFYENCASPQTDTSSTGALKLNAKRNFHLVKPKGFFFPSNALNTCSHKLHAATLFQVSSLFTEKIV